MCGNGIRCVAKYAYDYGIVDKTSISVATKSGIKYLDLTVENGKVSMVKVNMGAPIMEAKQIPVVAETEQVINAPIEVDGETYHMTAVSMGNPHTIVYMDEIDNLEIEKIGPSFENHKVFPDRVNTEFVKVIDRNTVQMRVWERGSGETLACGTGACAVTVASILNGHVDGDVPVTVKLLGGDLSIYWNREENLVYMTGPASVVFDGEIDLTFLGEE
jgi:diaminopimelate epimerase